MGSSEGLASHRETRRAKMREAKERRERWIHLMHEKSAYPFCNTAEGRGGRAEDSGPETVLVTRSCEHSARSDFSELNSQEIKIAERQDKHRDLEMAEKRACLEATEPDTAVRMLPLPKPTKIIATDTPD